MRGLLLAASAVLLAAGCSSSSSRPAAPQIGAARTYHLAGFKPAGVVAAGKPVVVSFRIDQPSGAALVDYKRGGGPHTGIHLIIVREDLSVIIHRHPKVGPDGAVRQPIVFPKPGPYRVLVDAFTVTLHGAGRLKAIDPIAVDATAVDAAGRPVKFVPWYGALAHAIFFRTGSLDYFHTHVCSPGASGCTSVLGSTRVVGKSSTPGRLDVGVLVPV